jgi:SagB-type dehydrogenase family enzyme
MTLEQLATVLNHGARVRDFDGMDDYGHQPVYRAFPSAGARHPIDFVVVTTAVDGIDSGAWRYDAGRCQLVELRLDKTRIRSAVAKSMHVLGVDRPPPALVFAIADFERTLCRYRGGTAHVWRDAGAALAVLQITAAASGVAACIVGIVGELIYVAHPFLVADVGALALGSVAEC